MRLDGIGEMLLLLNDIGGGNGLISFWIMS